MAASKWQGAGVTAGLAAGRAGLADQRVGLIGQRLGTGVFDVAACWVGHCSLGEDPMYTGAVEHSSQLCSPRGAGGFCTNL